MNTDSIYRNTVLEARLLVRAVVKADDLATRTYKNNNSAADHRITVYDCIYDGSGNVTGFKIVDSGFGLDQVSKERFQIMYEGDEIHSIDEESIILLTYTK